MMNTFDRGINKNDFIYEHVVPIIILKCYLVNSLFV